MTGVAAQMCVSPDSDFKYALEHELGDIKWGGRKAVLSDLSPIATFIASSYNQHINMTEFQMSAQSILDDCHAKFDWLFETQHGDNGFAGPGVGHVNYIVWSHLALGKLMGTGVEVETKSRRMLALKDFADKAGLIEKHGLVEYPKYYLPKEYDYLICDVGDSFDAKGDEVMTHGGITLDEVVVPFIKIKAVQKNG